MDATYFWAQDQRSEQRKTGVKFRMGTLDKGLPISGNLVSFRWHLHSFLAGLVDDSKLIWQWGNGIMGNDNNKDDNN